MLVGISFVQNNLLCVLEFLALLGQEGNHFKFSFVYQEIMKEAPHKKAGTIILKGEMNETGVGFLRTRLLSVSMDLDLNCSGLA